MHRKILIANRGVVASRIIETCKNLGIKTAIAYTLADKDTLPVKMADEMAGRQERGTRKSKARNYGDNEGIFVPIIMPATINLSPPSALKVPPPHKDLDQYWY